jgi:tetratricopeptide (TPR) repeat protein
MAMAMQKQGDVGSAEQVLRHNLTIDPMHQPTYHALSQILISQQRTAEAEALLVGWQESQPYVPEAYIEHAWLQHETGNKAEAEQTLQQALQVKPNHPVALSNLGQLYHEMGQADQAASYYQRSLLVRWNQPEVHSRLASLTGSTSAAVNLHRSAMIHNEPLMAANSIPMGDGVTVTQVSMPSGEVIAFDEGGRRPRRFNRRHMRGDDQQLAAFPLPSYGAQPGLITAAEPSMLPVASTPTILPEVANQTLLAPPEVAATPTPTPVPQADPAHATEAVAALPVVEPY